MGRSAHPGTGKVIGSETEERGEAVLQRVEAGRSVGDFLDARASRPAGPGNLVITK